MDIFFFDFVPILGYNVRSQENIVLRGEIWNQILKMLLMIGKC